MPTDLTKLYLLTIGLIGAFLVLGFALLPGKSEQEIMLRSADRLPEAIALRADESVQSLSNPEAAAHATTLFAAGDIEGAIRVFEELDAQRRLDAIGLEFLAHYYGQNHELEKRYATLLRLAEDHLNEDDARTLAGNFEAIGSNAEHMQMLETMYRRGFAKPEERLKLARIYRSTGQRTEALVIFESLFAKDMANVSVSDMKTLYRLMNSEGRQSETPDLFQKWAFAELPADELAARLGYLLDIGEDDLVIDLAGARRGETKALSAAYEAAVYRQIETSDLAKQRYVDLLVERLEDAATNEEQEQLIFEIFNYAQTDIAHSLISASRLGGSLLFKQLYKDRLLKEGRVDRVVEMLVAESQTEGTGKDEHLRIIDEISTLGQYPLAAEGYRNLINQYGPEPILISRLSYAWKMQGRPPDIDWIGMHMLTGRPDQFDDWRTIFIAAAPPQSLLDWLDARPVPANLVSDVALLKLELVQWTEDRTRLGDYVASAAGMVTLSSNEDIETLKLACALQREDAAVTIIARLNAKDQLPVEGHLCAAQIYSRKGSFAAAAAHYGALQDRGFDLSLEDTLSFAEAAKGINEPGLARNLKLSAIGKLQAIADPNPGTNLTLGYLLIDTGQQGEAIEPFKSLLSSNIPAAQKLEVQRLLKQIYMDTGDYESVLSIQ